MTGLTVPAAGPAATLVKSGAPSSPAVAGAPGAPSLAAFVDLLAGQPAATEASPAPAGKRQADATAGKSLPQTDDEGNDPALDWLFAAMPGMVPLAVATKAAPDSAAGQQVAVADPAAKLIVPGQMPAIDPALVATTAAADPMATPDLPAVVDAAIPLQDSTPDALIKTPAAAEPGASAIPAPAGKAAQLASVTPDALIKALGEPPVPTGDGAETPTQDIAPATPAAQPGPAKRPPAVAENPLPGPGTVPSARPVDGVRRAGASIAAPMNPATPAAIAVTPQQPAAVDAATARPAPVQPAPTATGDQVIVAAQPSPPIPQAAVDTGRPAEVPARATTGDAQIAQPAAVKQPAVPQATAITTNAPAAAMPALFALSRQTQSRREDADASTPGITSAASLLQPADATTLVAKPGEAQRQALDMGQHDWPQKMIDRIDALRDAANANDTSIRLKPDALGRVDVAIRNHGDGAISVHFTAESSTTRAMIADAQPQLNAAAEARGIRLSGTSVDLTGSGQGGEQQARQQFELRQNTSNRLAEGETETEAVADGRIA